MFAHLIHLCCLVFHSLQLEGLFCAHQITLCIRLTYNGQLPLVFTSPPLWQGSQGPPVFGMTLRNEFLPMANTEKTRIPLPCVVGCLLHMLQFSLPLQKELCNAEVAHLHCMAMEAVVWVSHPAPQKPCCRGVINIPVAHVLC